MVSAIPDPVLVAMKTKLPWAYGSSHPQNGRWAYGHTVYKQCYAQCEMGTEEHTSPVWGWGRARERLRA